MPALEQRTMAVLLLLGTLVGVTCTAARAVDYLPLKLGNVWVYYPGSGGRGYSIYSVIGTEVVGGTLTYIRKRLEAPPDNYHELMWLANDGTNVTLFQIWSNEVEPPVADPVLLDPPWLWWKDNPTVGDTWVVEGDVSGTHIRHTKWIESANATVVTPAGTFYNCIKVKALDEITNGSSIQNKYHRYWFAPDIGQVMYASYTKKWGAVKWSQKLVAYSLE